MLPPDPPKDSKSAAIQKLRLAEETLRARSRSIIPAQERTKLLYAASRIDTPKAALQLVQESFLSHSCSDSFLTGHAGETPLPHDALLAKATEETKRIKSRMYQRAHSFSVKPRMQKPVERRKSSICNRVISNAMASKYHQKKLSTHHVSFAPAVVESAKDLSEDSEPRSESNSPQTEEPVSGRESSLSPAMIADSISANEAAEPTVVGFFATEIQLPAILEERGLSDEVSSTKLQEPGGSGPCNDLSNTLNSFSSSGRNNSEVSGASTILSSRTVTASASADRLAVDMLARDVAAYLSAFLSSDDDSDDELDGPPRVAASWSAVAEDATTAGNAGGGANLIRSGPATSLSSPSPHVLPNGNSVLEGRRPKELAINQPLLPPLGRDRDSASTPQKNLFGSPIVATAGGAHRRRSETDAVNSAEVTVPGPSAPSGLSPAPPVDAPLTRTGSWKAQHRRSTGSAPVNAVLPPSTLFLSPVKSPPLVPALAIRRNSGQSAHASIEEASPDSFVSAESFPRQRGGGHGPSSAGVRGPGPETTIHSSRSGVSSDFDFDILGVRRMINSRASSRQDLLDGKSENGFGADEDDRGGDATSRIVLNAAVLQGMPVHRYDHILGTHSGVSLPGSAGEVFAPSPYPGAAQLKREASIGSKSISSTVSSCDKKLAIINDVPIIASGAHNPEQKWLKNVVEGYLTSAIVATSSVDFTRSRRMDAGMFSAAQSSGRPSLSHYSDENEANRDGFISARSDMSSFSSDPSVVATRNVLSELNPALVSLVKAVVMCQESKPTEKSSALSNITVVKHSVVPSVPSSLTSSDDAKMPISPVAVIRKKRRSTLGSVLPDDGDNKTPCALMSSEVNVIQTIDEDSQFPGSLVANPEMRLFPEYFSKFPIAVGRRRAARNIRIKRQYHPLIDQSNQCGVGNGPSKSTRSINVQAESTNSAMAPVTVTDSRDILVRQALKNALRAGQLIADLISKLPFIE
jgi:hypothetical protein